MRREDVRIGRLLVIVLKTVIRKRCYKLKLRRNTIINLI